MSLRKNYNKSLLGSDWIFALVFQANTKSDKYIFMVVMSLCAHNTHTKPNKPPFIVLRGNLTTPWELVWYFVSSKWAEVFSQSCEQFKGINEFRGRREELSWQWEKRHTAEFWEIEPSEVWWFSQIQAGASLFFFFFLPVLLTGNRSCPACSSKVKLIPDLVDIFKTNGMKIIL